MPHLIVELSDSLTGIDEAQLLSQLNTVLLASGEFRSGDIKSRIYHAHTSLIGQGNDGTHFAVATIKLLAGRTDNVKTQLVQDVLTALQDTISHTHQNVQYGVDIVELSEFYKKGFV